jgi:SulP family sulfate permease
MALGSLSLVVLHLWPKAYAAEPPGWRSRARFIPATVIVLAIGIALVASGLVQVPTIGSRFGGIPVSLPIPSFPDIDWPKIREVLIPAFSIALLCGIESLLCARMADGLIRERHDPNQELMAQGLANLLVPLFGGIAATGTIARTVTNVRSGARSPISGIVHSLTLASIVMLAAPFAANIPLAVLAAILLFVAWHMGDWLAFDRIRVFSVAHRVLMVSTFVLTVVYDLTVAVQIGMGLACLLFLHRMAGLSHAQWEAWSEDFHAQTGVAVCRLHGPLFFGAVDRLESVLDAACPPALLVIVDMSEVSYLDTSALEVLEDYERVLRELGGALAVVGAPENVASLIRRSGFLEKLAGRQIHASRGEALALLRIAPPHA